MVAGLMLFHGIAKAQNGVGWIGDSLVSMGFPYFIAYGAYIGEIIAPVLIILGILTRPAALVMAVNMIVAILMVGASSKFFTLTKVGAWGSNGGVLHCRRTDYHAVRER